MNLSQAEDVMKSAERRIIEARDSLLRLAFGDAEYHQEVKHVRVLDELATYDDPPAAPRLPGWKRHNWARRLRG